MSPKLAWANLSLWLGTLKPSPSPLSEASAPGHDFKDQSIAQPCSRSALPNPQPFRLFTFLLDKNGQLNYNIDITEPKAWII